VGDGLQAQVKLCGFVTDGLADIVAGNAADITQVTVGGQAIPVSRVTDPASLTRPYAFRGNVPRAVEN
jgi:hypothetical protein